MKQCPTCGSDVKVIRDCIYWCSECGSVSTSKETLVPKCSQQEFESSCLVGSALEDCNVEVLGMLKPNTVIRLKREVSAQAMHNIQKCLQKVGVPGIVLVNGLDLELLDEGQMQEFGWYHEGGNSTVVG